MTTMQPQRQNKHPTRKMRTAATTVMLRQRRLIMTRMLHPHRTLSLTHMPTATLRLPSRPLPKLRPTIAIPR